MIFNLFKNFKKIIKEIKSIDLSGADEIKDLGIDPNSKPI